MISNARSGIAPAAIPANKGGTASQQALRRPLPKAGIISTAVC